MAVNGTTPQSFPCVATTCTGTFSAPAGGTVNTFRAPTALDTQPREPFPNRRSRKLDQRQWCEHVERYPRRRRRSRFPSALSARSRLVSERIRNGYRDRVRCGRRRHHRPLFRTARSLRQRRCDRNDHGAVGNAREQYVDGYRCVYVLRSHAIRRESRDRAAETSTTETTPSGRSTVRSGPHAFTTRSRPPARSSALRRVRPSPRAPSRCRRSMSSTTSRATGRTSISTTAKTAPCYWLSLGPTATSPVTYTSTLSGPNWVAANGGIAPSGNAQMYVANGFGLEAVVGFQGSTSAPPFPLPPDTAVQGGGGASSRGSIAIGPTGSVFASFGGPSWGGTVAGKCSAPR